jgi:hypothetical protein
MSSLSIFYCDQCKKKFEGEKTKDETMHPIYGACWKYVATCPECKTVCDEYKDKVSLRSSPDGGCCMERSGGHQHSGCCCCN